MKKPLLIGIIVALVVIGLGYFILSNNDDDEPVAQDSSQTDTTPSNETEETGEVAPAEASEVSIDNRAFAPGTVTVKKGTTVTWTNNDDMSHDVTPDTETADFQQSDLLATGDIYTVTFNTPGTYTYHCSPHPDMTGTVVVTE